MTDEEYGRRWSRQQGIPVWSHTYHRETTWEWRGLPDIIPGRLNGRVYDTEAEAFTALGKAIREVHRQVPPLESTDAD